MTRTAWEHLLLLNKQYSVAKSKSKLFNFFSGFNLQVSKFITEIQEQFILHVSQFII